MVYSTVSLPLVIKRDMLRDSTAAWVHCHYGLRHPPSSNLTWPHAEWDVPYAHLTREPKSARQWPAVQYCWLPRNQVHLDPAIPAVCDPGPDFNCFGPKIFF